VPLTCTVSLVLVELMSTTTLMPQVPIVAPLREIVMPPWMLSCSEKVLALLSDAPLAWMERPPLPMMPLASVQLASSRSSPPLKLQALELEQFEFKVPLTDTVPLTAHDCVTLTDSVRAFIGPPFGVFPICMAAVNAFDIMLRTSAESWAEKLPVVGSTQLLPPQPATAAAAAIATAILLCIVDSPPWTSFVRPCTSGRQGIACGEMRGGVSLAIARLHPCGIPRLSTERSTRTPPDMTPELPPGAPPRPPDLTSRLAEAADRRTGPPRTRHLRENGRALFVNRLALESSPYLLQHAHNPVDWRPWGDEAFAEARARDVPVFLSVGYSTCHWCHVMEEESFEDLEIAEVLNRLFVPVKVDREERPDVDSIYMQAVQLLTQHGGWPMSVFLTPDRKPFYGGTYFPPRDGVRGARVGFLTLLKELHRVYAEERARATDAAEQISLAVKESLAADRPADAPGLHVLHGAMRYYAEVFDPQEGGVRRAPKFPSSLNVRFLLRYAQRTGDEQALRMATLTLTKMALGGIYDQVGGGFHRYSTDAHWLVPHFEKMLYDNALLVSGYVEAWQKTGDTFFRDVAADVLEYVAREMTDPGGAFWSATDADSEGEEGTFFVWTPQELTAVLGEADGARAAELFGVTPEGNFEGKSVLSLARVPDEDERAFLRRIRPQLYAARARRPPPLTDRKILTSWNGLMISAFARAGLALGRGDLVDRATRAADYLLRVHRASGRLARSSMDGVARHAGLLEDHAFLAAGLVDLFQATGEPRWLAEAERLHDELEARFADRQNGGFFRTPSDGEELLAREKPAYDGAEPTGNSVAALTLLRLEALTGTARWREAGERTLKCFGALLAGAPAALGEMLLAVDFALGETKEIVLVRAPRSNDASLLDVIRPLFLPDAVLIRAEEGNQDLALARDRTAIRGAPAAYVCIRGACQLPVTDPAELRKQLA
jgi:uncharacterized protein